MGQLQEKKDSQAQITGKEIAALLQEGNDGNVGLARAKAQNLIHEDTIGDLLEALEMHVGVIVEHFSEIEHKCVFSFLVIELRIDLLQPSGSSSPIVAEAASSIIFAAPHTESKGMCTLHIQ